MSSRGTAGLFTRADVKAQTRKATKRITVDVRSLHAMGTKAVRNMNPQARTPEMPPDGSRDPDVYLLGEAPDEQDDGNGRPFSGSAGRLLRHQIPQDFPGGVRANNVVRTLPPYRLVGGKRTRQPLPTEVECFRPSLEADIAKARPRAIIGAGNVPLHWLLGDLGTSVAVSRGRRFPVKVGGHSCWFYPVHAPNYIQRIQKERVVDERGKKVPGEEMRRMFDADVARVFEDLEAGLPEPEIESASEESLYAGVECIDGGADGVSKVKRALKRLSRRPFVTTDIESNRIRPYEPGAKVLSLALGTYEHSVAIAIDHPQARWTPQQRKVVLKLIRKFLRNARQQKVCHNLIFDLEWYAFLYGIDFIRESGLWHDTMQQAYSLDERQGGFSLNFLCALHLGLLLKSVSQGEQLRQTGLFATTGKIDRAALERTRLDFVLKYNALDVKFTHKVHRKQCRQLKDQGLWDFYLDFQNARIPTLVEAQWDGMPTNQATVQEIKTQLQGQVQKYLRLVGETDEVRGFVKRYGTFSPENNNHVTKLFRDFLGRKEGVRGKSYSTDADTLRLMKLPVADLILKLRDVAKSLSTYIDPLDRRSKHTVVFPDGVLHTSFKPAEAESGRTSSEGPNMQNFPKRKNKYIRRCVAFADKRMRIVSIDYGALEYRGIGMLSKDKVIIDSLWNDYDVHMVWTKKIVAILGERWFKKRFKCEWKDARSAVKNEFVFPLFYGSAAGSTAKNLEVEGHKGIIELVEDDFKPHFKGVFGWQKEMFRFYERHLYVECLSGRRRRGPLSWNMIINSPVQGTCSDIVVDAQTRIARRVHEEFGPGMRVNRRARLNIHDDLTFACPEDQVEDLLNFVVPQMCNVPFKWAKVVPIVVEASVGENWSDMKECGKFRSDQLPKRIEVKIHE
jgi:uracil-DNA glycosylase family 4